MGILESLELVLAILGQLLELSLEADELVSFIVDLLVVLLNEVLEAGSDVI